MDSVVDMFSEISISKMCVNALNFAGMPSKKDGYNAIIQIAKLSIVGTGKNTWKHRIVSILV
jgi:hypothetical protein